MVTQSHHRVFLMHHARRADFLRTLIPIMSFWKSRRGGHLRILSTLFGTVVVTKSFSIKGKNHNQVLSRNDGLLLTVRLLYFQG